MRESLLTFQCSLHILCHIYPFRGAQQYYPQKVETFCFLEHHHSDLGLYHGWDGMCTIFWWLGCMQVSFLQLAQPESNELPDYSLDSLKLAFSQVLST